MILPEPGSFQDVIPSHSSAANVINSAASNGSAGGAAAAESSARAARNARIIVVGQQGELVSQAAVTSTMQNQYGLDNKADRDKVRALLVLRPWLSAAYLSSYECCYCLQRSIGCNGCCVRCQIFSAVMSWVHTACLPAFSSTCGDIPTCVY